MPLFPQNISLKHVLNQKLICFRPTLKEVRLVLTALVFKISRPFSNLCQLKKMFKWNEATYVVIRGQWRIKSHRIPSTCRSMHWTGHFKNPITVKWSSIQVLQRSINDLKMLRLLLSKVFFNPNIKCLLYQVAHWKLTDAMKPTLKVRYFFV